MQTEAGEEARRLEECLAALIARTSRMEEELSAFEAAHREASQGGGGAVRPNRRTERKVERTEEALDRAMTGAGGASRISRTDAQAAKVAEIDAMQKSALVAQRMAALRAASPAR